jgi:hypothetical protein
MWTVTGCLYTAPVWRPGVNVPPRIVDPAGSRGEEHALELFSNGRVAQVVASDDDSDDLVFLWNVPGYPDLFVNTSSDEGGLWLSYVSIPYDPDLDGVLVRVVVVDQSPSHNAETVLFRVEVP